MRKRDDVVDGIFEEARLATINPAYSISIRNIASVGCWRERGYAV
jgi:hypothetical protein